MPPRGAKSKIFFRVRRLLRSSVLGQAVYDRRTALGLSQAELASRAGTTQTVISRLEGGSVTPTLPLLHRLAGALEGQLDIKITGNTTRAEFPALA